MPRDYTPAIDCTNEQRQAIALQPVTSNQIASVGYSHETKTLAVSFTRGAGNGMDDPEPGPGDDVSDARILSLTDGPLDSELDQAYQDGYQAYLEGKPKSDCPVMRHELVAKWTAGWEAAKATSDDGDNDDPSVATGDGGAA